jgi:hypothetical protein
MLTIDELDMNIPFELKGFPCRRRAVKEKEGQRVGYVVEGMHNFLKQTLFAVMEEYRSRWDRWSCCHACAECAITAG